MKIKIPPSGSFQHVTIGLLTVLLLAGLLALAYWHAPDNVFHFDDLDNIVNAPAVRLDHLSFDGLVKAGQQAFLPNRPLTSVTFALNWWQGGGDPKQFQWTNLALHAVNTILVLLLLAIALGRLFDGEARHRVWLAVGFGVAIWAVHPIQVQSVTYIVQRMNLMAGLFVMLSLLLYVRGRLWSRRPWLCYMGAGLSMLLGMMS